MGEDKGEGEEAMPTIYDLIVIGAGPGGYEAAAHAGQMGKKVLLIEKGPIGGNCLNSGCIPTKTLLKSSRVLADCREAKLYGVNTSEPSIDLSLVHARKRKLIAVLTKGVETLLRTSGVEVVKGEASFVAPDCLSVDDNEFRAANILIASGSHTSLPPISGIDSSEIHDSTSLLELESIPKSLVIIGAGIIGLEFACYYAELGTKVTLIEMLPHISAAIDPDIAKRLISSMKRAGVDFLLSATVDSLYAGSVNYTLGDGTKGELAAELTLNAAGRIPYTDGLSLEQAGVLLAGGAITVSNQGQTNVPGIWACGDVTGRMPLAHAATREGIVAVNSMFGGEDSLSHDSIPWVIFTHPEVAAVGPGEAQLAARNIPFEKILAPMGQAGRFLVENEGKSGTLKALLHTKTGQLLSLHMIGGQCGELIFGGALMLEQKMTIDDLRKVVFPHPTVSEALKEALTRPH
jgi:dihydrolipoamide dehydrogenase